MTPTEFNGARRGLGLTQAQLAQALGMNVDHVARLERGEKSIRLLVVLALRCLAHEARG